MIHFTYFILFFSPCIGYSPDTLQTLTYVQNSFSSSIHKVGNHVIFYTYIRTEWVRIFIIVSLILSEFSYGKVQILHCI